MKNIIIAISLFLIAAAVVQAEVREVRGDITDVIVYKGQALVTRTIKLDTEPGTTELIVGDLPSQIVPESLYAQGTGQFKILSVRYRTRQIREDTREEVKKLDLQIEEVTLELGTLNKALTHVKGLWQNYENQWKIVIDSKNVDVNRSTLVPEAFQGVTNYLEEKSFRFHKEIIELDDKIYESKKELDELNRKRKQLAEGNTRTERQALLYFNNENNGPASIELSYVVNGANWSPQYNLRANPEESMTVIEYNAVVHQSSGENWDNTNISLSTANPSLIASAPILEPMKVDLTSISIQARGRLNISNQMPQQQVEVQNVQILDQTQQFEDLIRSRKDNVYKGKMAEVALNRIALSNQMLELQADKKTQQQMQQKMAIIKRTEGVSVMYRLDGKLSLPSRSEQQIITIDTIRSESEFTLVATPVITDYVYLQAKILNESDTILLPGPANMYKNGQFVGNGDLQLVTIGQSFVTGFGIDSQIQVVRQFNDKKVETLWGNRVDQQQYTIEISNYKNEEVKLRLIERIPYTANPNIEIVLLEPSHELSKDREYLRTEKDKGILRWDLTLPAKSTNEKATIVKYEYTMKYDNDLSITTVK